MKTNPKLNKYLFMLFVLSCLSTAQAHEQLVQTGRCVYLNEPNIGSIDDETNPGAQSHRFNSERIVLLWNVYKDGDMSQVEWKSGYPAYDVEARIYKSINPENYFLDKLQLKALSVDGSIRLYNNWCEIEGPFTLLFENTRPNIL
ncbi:MAG: hypothetical protein K0R14_1398 [Burkholderiales bacterium]|jgi:hypothetical protein|nr:hypothetical protein [Burkholderiales bacterium]